MLQRLLRQQEAMSELARAALTGVQVEILLGQTCALVESVLEVELVGIFIPSADGWTCRITIGRAPHVPHALTSPELRDLLDRALHAGEADEVPMADENPSGHVAGAVPIPEVGGGVYGVMTIWSDASRDFENDELIFLRDVARLAGSMLESSRAVERIRASERRFRALIEHSSDGIVLIDAAARIHYVSPSTQRLFGYAESELLGQRIDTLLHPLDMVSARKNHALLLERRGVPVSDEIRVRTSAGGWLHLFATATNLLHEPDVGAIVINYRDVTASREAEQELQRLAYRDSLTDLPNRFLFNDRLGHALEQSQSRGTGVALLLLDLDHFKLVNDTLGHPAGDDLLRAFASRLSGLVRAHDTVARIGGDEFAILVNASNPTAAASRLASVILKSLRDPFTIREHQLYTHTSIGVSVCPLDGADAETLLKNADSALYRAKETGRNTVQMFAPSMNNRYRERLEIEQQLRRAVGGGELTLNYQPVVDLRTGAVTCVEGLVRWMREDGTPISPSTFIPVAEESGLILQMGEWVIRRALGDLKGWRSKGFSRLRLAINLSAHQIQQPNIVADLLREVRNAGVKPSDIELEVTESAAVQSMQWTLRVFDELRSHGFGLAIDDFGTGQSSLAYLKRFPLDTLKIDREFLQDVKRPADQAILSSIIQLGHSLGLVVIAEGIEFVDELRLLERFGCDAVQGFLLARPVAADEVPMLIHRVPEAFSGIRDLSA